MLVDFWTYTCINCLRTLPHVRAWDARYRAEGLTIVGVHTPEFAFEHDSGNVRDAIARSRLRYPVVQDNDYATWNAWGNQYWPAKYLIDAKGRVRYAHFGEGDYDKTEAAIRTLLAEAGAAKLGRRASVGSEDAVEAQTPETYLGVQRARGWTPAPRAGTHTYPARNPALNQFAFGGTWRIGEEAAEAVRGATIDARFLARKVYLVLSSRGARPRTLEVRVDGRLTRRVVVRRQRLYELVSLPRAGEHRLNLRFPPGLAGYAFTFG